MKRASIFLSTMHFSTRNVRIIGAVVIAIAMVGVSFWLSSSSTQYASALSTEDILRAYVEQDTDSDGLPDWQEQIYETDPGNPESVRAGMTDAEAVREGLIKPAFESESVPKPLAEENFTVPAPDSGSLTERFSQELMESYFAAGGPSEDFDTDAFVAVLLTNLESSTENLFSSSYGRIDVRISASVRESEYADALYGALTAPDFSGIEGSVPELASSYIEEGDAHAQSQLEKLATAFRAYVAGLRTMSVPSEFVTDHLALIRVYDAMGRVTDAFANYENDPLLAMAAVNAYRTNAEALALAVGRIAETLRGDEEPAPGTPEAYLLDFARSTANQP